MGLGIRVATRLRVKQGNGAITNSAGSKNEDAVWGRQADWCDYSGVVEAGGSGMAILSHPGNFRKPWFHARDYGLLVANAFGQNAFTEGEKSAVTSSAGEEFRLRYGCGYTVQPRAKLPIQPARTKPYLSLARK